MDKYKNKYRIASARLQHWDYRWSGVYFITICTQNREHFFGEIVDGKMQWSHVGIIADVLWHQIPHHANNVELGKFVVMPNHIHGVLIIRGDEREQSMEKSDGQINEQMSKISPKSNSISAIIRSYKSAVTKHANRLGLAFRWQARFHDHIIRDEQSYQNISNYIENNPANWQGDKFHNSDQ